MKRKGCALKYISSKNESFSLGLRSAFYTVVQNSVTIKNWALVVVPNSGVKSWMESFHHLKESKSVHVIHTTDGLSK